MVVISYICMLLGALVFPGILNRSRSLLSGRRGPGMLQRWYDVWRLLSAKNQVISPVTSLVFQLAPTIYLATTLLAMAMLPFHIVPGLLHFEGDFVYFMYILALGRFFLVLSALDTGSAFEGMGAARESLYSLLVEPAFFVLMGSLALLTGHTSFYHIFDSLDLNSVVSWTMALLAAYVLFQISLVENGRVPFDDPFTHLELTMIHEVMILDHSGFDLGLIHLASMLKFSMFSMLIANLFIPPHASMLLAVGIFGLVLLLNAASIGFVESLRARHRMAHNPKALLGITTLAVIVFFSVLILTNKFFV